MIDFYCVPTSNGQKIAILLYEMNIKFNLKMVIRKPGDPPTKEYLKINPVGKYPSIIHFNQELKKEIIVFETQAIVMYLTKLTGLLIPENIEDLNQANIWSNAISSGMTPLLGSQYFIQYRAKNKLDEINEWFLSEIKRYLIAFNLRLKDNSYLAGNKISFCDIIAYPVLQNSIKRLPIDLNEFNYIQLWNKKLSLRPAFRKGMGIIQNNN